MPDTPTILEGSSNSEKGAYLGAIASIATADREATGEEIEYLSQLSDAAGLSSEQKDAVIKAAQEITDEDARRCLDVLKTSQLKYSLVTDLIAFAKSDGNYTEDEKTQIQKMADYLGVNKEQFSLLDHFTDKAIDASKTNTASGSTVNTLSGAQSQPEQKDFLSSLGLKDKLQSAGINGNGLLKGLLGIAAPMLLAKMVTGGLNRNRGGMSGGGMFGSGGGMFGGGGGLFGGLGSVFSMFNSGGGGYRRSGGLLSRIFGGIF